MVFKFSQGRHGQKVWGGEELSECWLPEQPSALSPVPTTPLWSRDSVGRETCPHIGPELLRLSVLIPCFSRLSCLLVWLVIGIFMSLSVCPPDSSVSASLRRGPQAVS